MTSPNQLYAAAIQDGKVYVTSVSASPQPPIRFDPNVFPVVYVGDLATGTRGPFQRRLRQPRQARRPHPVRATGARLFLQEIVDLDFDGDFDTAYVVSRAADAVQRVNYDAASGITIGTDEVTQIDSARLPEPDRHRRRVRPAARLRQLLGHAAPRRHRPRRAERRSTRALGDLPPPGTAEDDVRLGERFFFTGRGRWSEGGEGYSSCGSCHPDGLSDDITWSFAAGPRQTTSLDGSFSHGAGPQKQRIFNWTAIFDEIHDFERNTRDVSGGLGAITASRTGQCGNAAEEAAACRCRPTASASRSRRSRTPRPASARTTGTRSTRSCRRIRPPRARLRVSTADRSSAGAPSSPATAPAPSATAAPAGRCRAASGRRRRPTTTRSDHAVRAADAPTRSGRRTRADRRRSRPTPTRRRSRSAANEVACVLRRVGTFGVPGDTATDGRSSRSANGSAAQGAGGFNVPSLYGLSVGAPYFHHGQARNSAGRCSPIRRGTRISPRPIRASLRAIAQIDDLSELPAVDRRRRARDRHPARLRRMPDVVSRPSSRRWTARRKCPPPKVRRQRRPCFFLDADGTVLTYQVDVDRTHPPKTSRRRHLHVAPPGFNGPVVLFLAASSPAELPLRGTLDGRRPDSRTRTSE